MVIQAERVTPPGALTLTIQLTAGAADRLEHDPEHMLDLADLLADLLATPWTRARSGTRARTGSPRTASGTGLRRPRRPDAGEPTAVIESGHARFSPGFISGGPAPGKPALRYRKGPRPWAGRGVGARSVSGEAVSLRGGPGPGNGIQGPVRERGFAFPPHVRPAPGPQRCPWSSPAPVPPAGPRSPRRYRRCAPPWPWTTSARRATRRGPDPGARPSPPWSSGPRPRAARAGPPPRAR